MFRSGGDGEDQREMASFKHTLLIRVPPENDWRSETRMCHLKIFCGMYWADIILGNCNHEYSKGSLFPFFNTQVENLYIYNCQFYVSKDFQTMSTRPPLLIIVFSALPVSRRPRWGQDLSTNFLSLGFCEILVFIYTTELGSSSNPVYFVVQSKCLEGSSLTWV